MTDAEHAAHLAQIDQLRAEAERNLDSAIADYRELRDDLDSPDGTLPFVAFVRTVHHLVDPDDQLPDNRSDALTKIAESFACAISRLIKDGDR